MVQVPTQTGFIPNSARADTEQSWQEFYLNKRGPGSLAHQREGSTLSSSMNPSKITDKCLYYSKDFSFLPLKAFFIETPLFQIIKLARLFFQEINLISVALDYTNPVQSW